jgi:DNA modification methylase
MEDLWFAVRDRKNYTFNLDIVKVRKSVIAPYRENGVPKDWTTDGDGKPFRMTHPSNIWTDLTVPFWSMRENTPHPTQKPEALAKRIILASSNPGDRVLDLFSGSGTFSVVAKRLGREFIGIEMNPEYIRYALKRLAMLDKESKTAL